MDHHRIEESNRAAAYAAGTLPPEEEAAFEEHLLECAACRKQVEIEEEMRLGFQAFAEEEGEPTASAVPSSPSRISPQALPVLAAPRLLPSRRSRRWLPAALAAAALLALAMPLVWLVAERGELREELARLRADAPLPEPPHLARPSPQSLSALRDWFEALEMKSLLPRLDKLRG
jgi:anti-sigma factor RsiW